MTNKTFRTILLQKICRFYLVLGIFEEFSSIFITDSLCSSFSFGNNAVKNRLSEDLEIQGKNLIFSLYFVSRTFFVITYGFSKNCI